MALAKSVPQVEYAWKILRPHFGTQLSVGFGRIVPAPNLFDLIAMGVLIELAVRPYDVGVLIATSTCVAEEVAIYLDTTDTSAFMDDIQIANLLSHLVCVFSTPPIDEKHSLLNQRWVDIAAVVLDVMEQVRKILIDNSLNGSIAREEQCGVSERIA
ncbi:hypothetical protein [uncultured Ruegeria sp.]|uniref:hypothetical protein n=1 Tax=uncultured Ruegeria sp. TaxID=259304 RepID=UPI002633B154|nr:hypothetical protein [uncultured Ruegeria sp.]